MAGNDNWRHLRRDKHGRWTKSGSSELTKAQTDRAKAAVKGFNPRDAAAHLASLSGVKMPAAVKKYQDGDWKRINEALRAGRKPRDVAAIDSALKPLQDDVVVSRRLPEDAFGLDVSGVKGRTIRDAAYGNGTLGEPKGAAKDGVTLRMAVPAGIPAAIDPENGDVVMARDAEIAIGEARRGPGGGWELSGVVLDAHGAEKKPRAVSSADPAAAGGEPGPPPEQDSEPLDLQAPAAAAPAAPAAAPAAQAPQAAAAGAGAGGASLMDDMGSFDREDDDAVDAFVADAEAFLREHSEITDAGTGMSARVSSVEWEEVDALTTERYGVHSGLAVTYDITDRDGNVVGSAERRYVPAHDGQPASVKHVEFKLNPENRGGGFASRWNRQMEDVYRGQGIERVTLDANMDVGGYAWAKQGYGWDPALGINGPGDVREQMERTLAGRTIGFSGTAPPDLTPEQRVEMGSLLARMTEENLAAGTFPSPLEISMLGWSEGATTWPGKAIMLNSYWAGAKQL